MPAVVIKRGTPTVVWNVPIDLIEYKGAPAPSPGPGPGPSPGPGPGPAPLVATPDAVELIRPGEIIELNLIANDLPTGEVQLASIGTVDAKFGTLTMLSDLTGVQVQIAADIFSTYPPGQSTIEFSFTYQLRRKVDDGSRQTGIVTITVTRPAARDFVLDTNSFYKPASGGIGWSSVLASDDKTYTAFHNGGGFGSPPVNGIGGDGVSLGWARITGLIVNPIVAANLYGGMAPTVVAASAVTLGGKCFGPFERHPLAPINNPNPPPFTPNAGVVTIYAYLGVQGAAFGGNSFFNRFQLHRSRANLALGEVPCTAWTVLNPKIEPVGWNNAFTCPCIVQHGPGDWNRPDGSNYVYTMWMGEKSALTFVNANLLYLTRVPLPDIELSLGEVFAGFDGAGNPLWNSDFDQRRPIYEGPVGWSACLCFVKDRYLIVCNACPTDNANISAAGQTDLTILEGLKPWGPFAKIRTITDWRPPGSTQNDRYAGTFYIPQSGVSTDGRRFTLVYGGGVGGNLRGMNSIKVDLVGGS